MVAREPREDSTYVALIGDIRQSRKVPERALLQTVMEEALATVNSRLEAELAAGFVLTLGDEFQGLLHAPSSVVPVLVLLEELLDGAEVRYGIGLGRLSTALQDVALRTDGPCFHRARAALVNAKRDDSWVTVEGFGDDDAVLNGVFQLMGDIRWNWTDTQRRTVELMRRAGTQKEVARERGVSINAVSKTLKSASFEPLIAAERSVATILERYPIGGKSTEVVS